MSNNKDKGLPQNPFRDRPPVPSIDPNRQQVFDTMNLVELQYAIAKAKEKAQQVAQQMAQQNQPAYANPVLREVFQDIDYLEKVTTAGFTVQYPPAESSEKEEKGESIGKTLLEIAVNNLTNNPKVAEGLGSFLSNQRIQDAIADILEGIGRKFVSNKGEK